MSKEHCTACDWVGDEEELDPTDNDVCPECGARNHMTTIYGPSDMRMTEPEVTEKLETATLGPQWFARAVACKYCGEPRGMACREVSSLERVPMAVAHTLREVDAARLAGTIFGARDGTVSLDDALRILDELR